MPGFDDTCPSLSCAPITQCSSLTPRSAFPSVRMLDLSPARPAGRGRCVAATRMLVPAGAAGRLADQLIPPSNELIRAATILNSQLSWLDPELATWWWMVRAKIAREKVENILGLARYFRYLTLQGKSQRHLSQPKGRRLASLVTNDHFVRNDSANLSLIFQIFL